MDEIEAIMQTDQKQLDTWCKQMWGDSFKTKYKEYCCNGKASLRRTQFRLSEKSAAMAIWLGKVYLDQKDTQEVKHTYLQDEDQIIQPEHRVTRLDDTTD